MPEVGHQISTLPLEATRVEYTFRTDAADGTVTLGKITLWAEGFFVKGFLELIEEDGLPWPFRDWRLLQDGGLRLASYVSGQISGRSVVGIELLSFSFEQMQGNLAELFVDESQSETGVVQLTKVSP